MKRNLLLIIAILITNTFVIEAQNRNENVNFGEKSASGIYLYSGKLIPLKKVRLKKPFLGRAHFKIEDKKVFASSVQFYSDRGTIYANTKQTFGNFREGFAKRIKEGKINLYELTVVNHTAGNMNMPAISTTKTFRYFNKGLNPLLKINYKNLIDSMSDNELSLEHLSKYKKKSRNETWAFVLGGVIAIGSAISFITKSDGRENPNFTLEYLGFTSGFGLYIYGWALDFAKDDDIDNAIDAYNR